MIGNLLLASGDEAVAGPVDLSVNLAGHFLLNNNNNDNTGLLTSNNVGTLVFNGDAMRTDGNESYVRTGHFLTASENNDLPFTISGWYRKTGIPINDSSVTGEKHAICGSGPTNSDWAFGLFVDMISGYVYVDFVQQATNGQGSIIYSVNTGLDLNEGYHHYAVTYDGNATPGGCQLYIDGVAITMPAPAVFGNYIGMRHDEFNIGAIMPTSSFWGMNSFGDLSNFRIYTDEKDQEFVTALNDEGYYPRTALTLPTTNGLVAHFPLTGTAEDATGTYDGTEIGGIAYSDDEEFGSVASKGAVGADRIDISPIKSGRTTFTVCGWFRRSDSLVYPYQDDCFWMNNTQVYWFVNNNGIGQHVQITGQNYFPVLNQWYFFEVDSDRNVYIDGVLKTSTTNGTGITAINFSHGLIGSNSNGVGFYGNACKMKDYFIYDRVLTLQERADIRRYTKNFRSIHIDDGLIAYLPMKKNALDHCYRENDGTAVGGIVFDGNQAVLDGIDDQVSLSGIAAGASYSVSLWSTYENAKKNNYFFGAGSANAADTTIYFGISGYSQLVLGLYGENTLYGPNMTVNPTDLYHYVVTYNNVTNLLSLYFNNKLVASKVTTADYAGNLIAVIGDVAWTGTVYDNQGKMKDFRLYDKDIVAEQVDVIFYAEGGVAGLGELREPQGPDDLKGGYMYWMDVGLSNVTANGTVITDDFAADPRQRIEGVQATATLTEGSLVFTDNTKVWGGGVGTILNSLHSKMCWGGDDSEFTAWIFDSPDGTTTHAGTKIRYKIKFTAVGGYSNNTYEVTEYDPVTQVPTVIKSEVNWYTGTYAAKAAGSFEFNRNSIDFTQDEGTYGLRTHSLPINHPLPDRFYITIYARAYGTYTQSCTALSRMRLNNMNLVDTVFTPIYEDFTPAVLVQAFNDDFPTLNSATWFSWGNPLPYIKADGTASNGFALDQNGDANYHSGVGSNGYQLDKTKQHRIKFRAKTVLNGTNPWSYFQVGLMDGPAFSSTTDGTAGNWRPLYIRIDGGAANSSTEVQRILYAVTNSIVGNGQHVPVEYDNDGEWHEYEIYYAPVDFGDAIYILSQDGIMKAYSRGSQPATNLYLDIQGRSYSIGDGLVDWINVESEL